MTTETIWVTRAPPRRSEIMPPMGRISAPMKGPVQAYISALGPFGLTVVWVITPSTSICWKPNTTLRTCGAN